jgi:aspartate/methionine/tyrosine aminotransferase
MKAGNFLQKLDPYTADNVMLVPGGIQAFSLLTEALLKLSDEVLIPNPSYFSLAALTETRYTHRIIEAKNFNFTASAYQHCFTINTKLAWFCQPNNPTGTYIKTRDLQGIIKSASTSSAYVVLDESCDNYVFIEPPYPALKHQS